MSDFKVTLIGLTEEPELLSAAGALGCFEEKSSAQILQELKALPREQREKKVRAVIKNSFGRGHGSVGDQNYFIFCIEDLPRAATLHLCLPEYLAHLQQSLRRTRASRGFYLPEVIKRSRLAGKTEEILFQGFQLYKEMVQAGIPKEDARSPLSLYTKTTIQTAGNARELSHLSKMSKNVMVPSVVRAIVNEMITLAKKAAPILFEDFRFNYEGLAWYPSVQLYAPDNELLHNLVKERGQDEDILLLSSNAGKIPISKKMVKRAVVDRDEAALANLKHLHFEFLVPMSLTCFHQAIRQRTWNHSCESIYDAMENDSISDDRRMVIPPSIKELTFHLRYRALHMAMLGLYRELIEEGIPKSEAIGVIPHSLKIWTLIHVNGWNAIHSIGKRTCLTAQWEIRRIAREMAKIIKWESPALKKWIGPQCVTYGYCPEIEQCGYFQKVVKRRR